MKSFPAVDKSGNAQYVTAVHGGKCECKSAYRVTAQILFNRREGMYLESTSECITCKCVMKN